MISNDMMKFGNKMQIRVRLPTRDRALAEEFLKDPTIIIESTYDKSRALRLSETLWRIKFAEIPIPGIDVVSPELEIDFRYDNQSIYMKSDKWALKGNNNGKILKDSKFMSTFNIKLTGQLSIELNSQQNAPMVASGWVIYEAEGHKPAVLRNAPSFILDGTINLIQSLVADFVTKKFGAKLLQSFTLYSNRLVSK
jgi:hypothetical protein